MILVSACLLGVRCRYDGESCEWPDMLNHADGEALLPVCPEQLGGLPTPREPAVLSGEDGAAILAGKGKVLTRSGKDVTTNFLAGVEAVLQIISRVPVEKAILKEKSPSCGVGHTYVDGELTPGRGLLAEALVQAGIPLVSDEQIKDA